MGAFGDPLGFFNAGQAAGKESANPFQIASGNVMDVFKANIENQMKLAQTAALFKGEKQYDYANDPTKVTANFENAQRGLGSGQPGGGMPSIPGGSQPQGGATNTIQSAASSQGSQNGDLQVKSMKYGIYDLADPSYDSKVEQHKKIFESDSNLKQLTGILDNYAQNLKSAYLEQGGQGGIVAGGAGSALASLKQPNTSYIRGLQNLKVDATAALARQLQGSSQGIQKMFQVTSHNIPDNWDNPDAAGSMLTDMVTNAYVITQGVKQAGLSDDQIMKMSPDQIHAQVDKFKTDFSGEKLQALRDHLGEHFGSLPPAESMSLTGQPNTLETNPLIKKYLGENQPGRDSLSGWNEISEQAKLQRLVAGDAGNKDAYVERFKQRKKEALGHG